MDGNVLFPWLPIKKENETRCAKTQDTHLLVDLMRTTFGNYHLMFTTNPKRKAALGLGLRAESPVRTRATSTLCYSLRARLPSCPDCCRLWGSNASQDSLVFALRAGVPSSLSTEWDVDQRWGGERKTGCSLQTCDFDLWGIVAV